MLNATKGRELALQFGTVPAWMQIGPTGDRRWDYGQKPWNDTLVWNYNAHGNYANASFRDLDEVANYFSNFMAYYTAGGFTDAKTGKRYDSGFHYGALDDVIYQYSDSFWCLDIVVLHKTSIHYANAI